MTAKSTYRLQGGSLRSLLPRDLPLGERIRFHKSMTTLLRQKMKIEFSWEISIFRHQAKTGMK